MRRYSTKPFIDSCKYLSIRCLIDFGCFRPGSKGKAIVFFREEDGQDVSYLWCKPESEEDGTHHVDVSSGFTFFGEFIGTRYRIRLIELPAHFGGKRYQFECPGNGCGRKVRALYLVGDGVELLCRVCHGLRYRSSLKDYRRKEDHALPKVEFPSSLGPGLEWQKRQGEGVGHADSADRASRNVDKSTYQF